RGAAHTTRRGNPVGTGDFLTVQFRHAVYELTESIEIVMLMAVPGIVITRIVQAEVGTEVDHDRSKITNLRQHVHADAVWQREEKHIGWRQVGTGDELEIGDLAQVRVRGFDELAGLAFAGDLGEFDVRMSEQQTNEFAAGVAGSA